MYKTSVYTLVNGKIEELAHHKQQKSQKGDIIQQHIGTQSVWCGQNHLMFCTFIYVNYNCNAKPRSIRTLILGPKR